MSFMSFSSKSDERAAQAAIRQLMLAFGASGLIATAGEPGLSAAVDQHAAAIRDGLRGDLRPLTPIQLAGYAEGVQQSAEEQGWQLPVGPVDWPNADWVLVRLLAVCYLATQTS